MRGKGAEGVQHTDLPAELSEEIASEVSQIFKALGDPTRLKILYLLAQQEVSVNEISVKLELKQSTVSHQLRLLKSLRLVKFRRAGTTLFYSCDDSHVMNTLIETIKHTLHH